MLHHIKNKKSSGIERELSTNYNDFRRDVATAEYLFNNLSQSSLIEIKNVVLNGLNNFECGFNDSLLFLSNSIDSNKMEKHWWM